MYNLPPPDTPDYPALKPIESYADIDMNFFIAKC